MKIGVLGTGIVGRAIGTKLVALRHKVMMGSRTADNEKALEWVASVGEGASRGTFADAAAHGELLFNCTGGEVSVDAIGSARARRRPRGEDPRRRGQPPRLLAGHAPDPLCLRDGQPR